MRIAIYGLGVGEYDIDKCTTGCAIDAALLRNLLLDVNTEVDIIDFERESVSRTYDIGIFIQDYNWKLLRSSTRNIFIPNEEWINHECFEFLENFDVICCKSSLCKELLAPFNANCIHTGFISRDMYETGHGNARRPLFFNGKSDQKGHELIDALKAYNLTVVDQKHYPESPTPWWYVKNEELHVNEVKRILNRHPVHLCPSLYEGWGHAFFEAMSCGALILASPLPVWVGEVGRDGPVHFMKCKVKWLHPHSKYSFLAEEKDLHHPLKKGYVVTCRSLMDSLKNLNQLLEGHNPENTRSIFKYIMDKNGKRLRYAIL